MSGFRAAQGILANREVVVAFVGLVAFYAVANLVIAPVGKPLEPLAESVFTGYWAFRRHFRIGGFLTQIFFTWLWFFLYSYLLALLVGTAYRRYR
jgi:hypothetical protein